MDDLTYLTSTYDDKIARIREFGAPLNFLFITDAHNRLSELASHSFGGGFELAADAVHSMQYIIDRVGNVCCVVNGGDIGNDYDYDPAAVRASQREYMDALYSLSVPVHSCVGNHDDAIGHSTEAGLDNSLFAVLPDEMHALCMKYNPTPENYYYADFDICSGAENPNGWRFVFLNTSDIPYFKDENGRYTFGWDNAMVSVRQAKWLESQALDTDRRILVFGHIPIRNEHIYGSADLPDGIKPYDDLLNAPRVRHALLSDPKVSAYICGHVHFDNMCFDGELLYCTSQCAYARQWSPRCPERVFGTASETAFDMFSIKDRSLLITRFGCGESRSAELRR